MTIVTVKAHKSHTIAATSEEAYQIFEGLWDRVPR